MNELITYRLSMVSLRNANRAFGTQVRIANAESQKTNEAVYQKLAQNAKSLALRKQTHENLQIALRGRLASPNRVVSIDIIWLLWTCDRVIVKHLAVKRRRSSVWGRCLQAGRSGAVPSLSIEGAWLDKKHRLSSLLTSTMFSWEPAGLLSAPVHAWGCNLILVPEKKTST